MIQIIDPSDCCGCTACVSVCSHNAITMVPDSMGFLYPKVDQDKCIDCGLCEKVCAFNDSYNKSFDFNEPLAFAVRHKNMREVETSRSGAAFIALSDWILDDNGVVYGAGYENHFKVVHKRATTKEERDEFKGSKYVQSDLNTVFRDIRNDLKQGKKVLFSGTPCQTSGLCSFIGKHLRKNLFVVDIVCHGVPSPYIWRDYIDYQEKKNHCSFENVDFRNKKLFGWTEHKESLTSKGKTVVSSIYTRLFYMHIMFRPSCKVCHFTNLKRPSDITIADFWGWEKTNSEMNKDDKGISLVLINTNKGNDWFKEIKSSLYVIPAKLENCMQPNLQHPSLFHAECGSFEKDYTKYGLVYVLKKYAIIGRRYYVNILKRKTKTLIRLILKK